MDILVKLREILAARAPDAEVEDDFVEYIGEAASGLLADGTLDAEAWQETIAPYLLAVLGEEEADAACEELRAYCGGGGGGSAEDETVLVDAKFSLVYGGRTLLRHASMRLERGRRYAIIGDNGAGKTTLLRNLAKGSLEGFPHDLRTVFIQPEAVTGRRNGDGVNEVSRIIAPCALPP